MVIPPFDDSVVLILINRPIVISANIQPNEAIFVFQLKFVKSVPRGYCWQLELQFTNPFHLRRGVTYAVWYQGMLVARPGGKSSTILHIQRSI